MRLKPKVLNNADRPRRGLLMLAASVLVIAVAVAASGCGTQVTSYVDPEYGFSFDYLDSWQLTVAPEDSLPLSAARSVGIFDPRGSDAGNDLTFDYISVDVYEVGAGTIPTSEEFNDYFAFYIEQLQASDDSLQITDALRPTSVNGNAALKVTYAYVANDTAVRCSEYRVIDSRGIIFGLLLQASAENWERDGEPFSIFLDTFRLRADL